MAAISEEAERLVSSLIRFISFEFPLPIKSVPQHGIRALIIFKTGQPVVGRGANDRKFISLCFWRSNGSSRGIDGYIDGLCFRIGSIDIV